MTSIASTLKSKNCKLFYMSVNPINSTMITKSRKRRPYRGTGKRIQQQDPFRSFSGLQVHRYVQRTYEKKATGPMLPTMAQTLTVMMDFTTQQRHSRGSTITALLISTQEVSTHLIINGITDRKIPSAGDIPPGGIFSVRRPAIFLSDRAITPCTNHENSLYLIRYGRLEVRRDV